MSGDLWVCGDDDDDDGGGGGGGGLWQSSNDDGGCGGRAEGSCVNSVQRMSLCHRNALN